MTQRKEIEHSKRTKEFFLKRDLDKPLCINTAIEWADKTMIEKACQWIESYLFDIGFPDDWCRDSATMKSGKQRFLEAMEE